MKTIDKIEVKDKVIRVRELENGVYHRYCVSINTDTSNLPDEVKAAANALFTSEKRQLNQQKLQSRRPPVKNKRKEKVDEIASLKEQIQTLTSEIEKIKGSK